MNEEFNYSPENGLSREEHKWLSEQFNDREKKQLEQIDILQEQMKVLRRINSTLQIIAVIALVTALLITLQLLGL
jgi:hypothetical protein